MNLIWQIGLTVLTIFAVYRSGASNRRKSVREVKKHVTGQFNQHRMIRQWGRTKLERVEAESTSQEADPANV